MRQAGDTLQNALIAEKNNRLWMFESYQGSVMQVDDDSVVVTYLVDDDYIDQTYRKEQFIGARLPKVGDRLAVYVHIAELPSQSKKQTDETMKTGGTDEQRKHRKKAIRPPREF